MKIRYLIAPLALAAGTTVVLLGGDAASASAQGPYVAHAVQLGRTAAFGRYVAGV